MSAVAHRGALEALDRILNRGGDADDVLRAVVDLLWERVEGISWVGVSLVEGDELVLGPSRGERAPRAGAALAVPVSYGGSAVARVELEREAGRALDDADRAFLERVALLISPFCLVGWDTGGESWE